MATDDGSCLYITPQNPKTIISFKSDLSIRAESLMPQSKVRGKAQGTPLFPNVSECPVHRFEPRSSDRCPGSAALTSVVLHAGVVGDALRPKAQAQDVPRVRTVSHQEGPIRLPLQLHLCVLPVHGSPVPTALGTHTGAERQREGFLISNQTQLSHAVNPL